MVKIRKATQNDLRKVQELNLMLFQWDSQFDNALNMEWTFGKVGESYFRDMIQNEFVVVAQAQDNVVGYLAGSLHNEKHYSTEIYAELDNMFVLEEWRKHGVGKALIQEFFNQCEVKGIKAIRVTASAKNQGAIEFYKRNGFTEFDITLRKRS